MKCDKFKQTYSHKAMQSCNICQECVGAATSVNVKECTDNENIQKKLRVNELLAYVNTYRHQSSKLKIQMACMKCYADQDVHDAKQVFYDEYRHVLGDPQNRQESNNRSEAEKSVEYVYVAFPKLDEMKVESGFSAFDIERLSNFTLQEMDLASISERLVRLENIMNNVEGNVSLCRTEQTGSRQK